MNIKNISNKKGQAMLILVIITMVAALGIGATVASKSVLDQRKSSLNTQSEGAFSAADAGVEEAIKNVKAALVSGVDPSTPTAVTNALEDAEYSYNIKEVGNKNQTVTIPRFDLSKDQVEVFNLGGNVDKFDVEFRGKLAMQVNLYKQDLVTPGNYVLMQSYYRCAGYNEPASGSGVVDATLVDAATSTCKIENVSALNASNEGYDLLTVVPIGNKASRIQVTLYPDSPKTVPLQAYEIDATGTIDQSHRTIKVLYMVPSLARIFNNTLYAQDIVAN